MKYSRDDLRELASLASNLARRVGARRFVMRPGKLIQLLNQIVNSPRVSGPPVGKDELADALRLLPLAQYQLEQIELRLLSEAREQKMSWSDIAEHLSLRSRQAAEQRLMRLKTAHGTPDGGKDVAPARAQRRRHNEVLELLTPQLPLFRRLAKLLPEAFEEHLYATSTGPISRSTGATWDRLPVDERASRRDRLLGDVSPSLRFLRFLAAEEENDPVRYFRVLGQLIYLLDRAGYQFDGFPADLLQDVNALREVLLKVGAGVIVSPTSST
ncbi:hypothetical protein SAMN04489731_1186 [Amycolatopsis regifaucium]|nr:hypothetical protein SAMN04489731_1186 [Amycolatopsis regifaucium]